MTTAPTPSELLALRAGAMQQIRLREKFGPEGLDLELDPQIVIRLLDRIRELESKVGRFQGVPLPLIEAINAATGSNEWQGDHSPAELLEPACRAIAELEARKPLPLSYRAGAMTSSVDGSATVSLHFNDMAEAEAWFVAITDQHDAGLVDKSPNLQEPLVDKTENLHDRPAALSDDDRLRLRSDVARAIWDVMREHEDRCGHALEDVEPKHQVWDCADAAIKAAHGITGGSS